MFKHRAMNGTCKVPCMGVSGQGWGEGHVWQWQPLGTLFREMLWRTALTLLLPPVSVYIYVFFALPFFLSYHFLSPIFISIPIRHLPWHSCINPFTSSPYRWYQTSSVGPMKVILKERWPQCLYVLCVVLIWSKASVKFVYLLFILTLEVSMRTICILLVEGGHF